MEHVAKDKGGDWYYDGSGMYWCKDSKNKIVGRLALEHVPDADSIWHSKCRQAEVKPNSQAGQLLKPNEVVYKISEHANAKLNK